ncbi:MAG: TonB-dependent receptor [Rhizobiaceae bacterium]|nr:TonB-dependent receptor [Rhizobiaceae bacterium]MCV0404742.1 TonB-dependent receptor [Rhizobiaceae bacterium]
MQSRTILLSAASLIALAAGAGAQEPAQSADVTVLDELIVISDPLGRSENAVAAGVIVLSGDQLRQRGEATLGDTLDGIPGIASDTFGGGASRPVIRGQTAPRVKVLSDGAGLFDASDVSPDHAIPVEPMLLDGVEVLRGPSALIYGGGAIGGAVNLLDSRIPTAVPENGIEGAVEFRGGTADRELSGAGGVTVGAGNIALRLEAAHRDLSDYRVPFYTPPSHGGHDDHDDHDDHGHEDAEGFGRLPGSFNESTTVSVGGSWVGSEGYIGVAYTERRARYGLPGHGHDYEDCHPHGSSLHCGGHDHGDDDHDHDDHGSGHVPEVDMVSRRLDLRGEWNDPFDGVERVRVRGGYTNYRHDELDDGVAATTFRNKGYDMRAEVQHAPILGLHGVVGAQFSDSDFVAEGEEGFIPQSNTRSGAIFLMEEYAFGDWRVEGALRQEWQNTSAVNRPDTSHSPFSASLAAHWDFTPGYTASVAVARSQRAPHVQELYARGIHFATDTYELGNPLLEEETANSIEVSLRKTQGPTTFSASVYHYDYDGYIYAETLDRYEDFRLVRYTQRNAEFTGVEGRISHEFTPWLAGSVFGDYVVARFDDGSALPRIPAARLGVRADFLHDRWSGSLEYYRVFEQDRIAAFETPTDGYNMVNATLAYDFGTGPFSNQFYLRGTNLLNETALNHSSFIKSQAPLRGRHIVVGLRSQF